MGQKAGEVNVWYRSSLPPAFVRCRTCLGGGDGRWMLTHKSVAEHKGHPKPYATKDESDVTRGKCLRSVAQVRLSKPSVAQKTES